MARSFERSAKDFYKVLQVPRTASIKEIKISYRKLALRLHPDIHKNDPKKTAEFQQVSEAYTVLSDIDKRNSYDYKIGARYNKNRRTAPPKDYRSVKFPKKPKHWKTVWDHELHYDMHYGDGMYREIIQRTTARLQKEGYFDYQSPIGNGFRFATQHEMRQNPNINNRNPYASPETPQGPPRRQVIFEFEEVNGMGGANTAKFAKDHIKRQIHVVEDLHGRREQRREYQTQREQAAQAKKPNAAFVRDPAESCVIL